MLQIDTHPVLDKEYIMAEVDEVQALLDQAIQAFNTRDFDTYFAVFSDDVEAFVGIQTPFRIEGKAAWRTFIEGLAALPVVTNTQRHSSYRVYNGNTVIVNGYFDFTVVTKDEQATTLNGRTSFTWVRVEGKWLIANQHYSRIFEGP
jgi:uncharacterized protein (TIGR02246 family)